MLLLVLRLSGKSLGVLAGLALLAHGILLAPGLPASHPGNLFGPATLRVLAELCFYALTGRVVLALLAPGDVGSHAPSDLPVTAATSLVLGTCVWTRVPESSPLLFLAVLGVGIVRWLLLPGAMVPRHAPPSAARGRLDALALIAAAVWAVYSLLVELFAVEWLALCVLVSHGLGVARRARPGRYAFLALGASLCLPPGSIRTDGVLPALSLGLGAVFLIPWLRRADKRAGLLSALGFGSVLHAGPTPLGLAGPLVLVLFSHARQRRFAALSAGLCALPFLLFAGRPEGGRGRLLWLPELVSGALRTSEWGLAWPLVAAALVLGALSFPWRGADWAPGTIEEPRREVRALCALIVLAGAALAVPSVPWAEVDVLVILFPPLALLAGLVLIPPERAAAPR